MLVVAGLTASARADVSAPSTPSTLAPPSADPDALDKHWPDVPPDHQLSLEDQITDHLSEIGNQIGAHMNVLSDDLMALKVDGRHNRARLRIGGGDAHFLNFKIDSDWLFADGKAHVKARLDLGVAGHQVKLELPDMDLSHDNWHGQDLVQVNVSVLERRF